MGKFYLIKIWGQAITNFLLVQAITVCLSQTQLKLSFFFAKKEKLAIMAILASTWKQKKIQQQNVTPLSIEPGTSAIWTWCSPLWAKYWGMCYLGDLRAFYGHALYWYLSPRLKWSRNKRQYKDVPNSTFLDSSDRKAGRPEWLGSQVQHLLG